MHIIPPILALVGVFAAAATAERQGNTTTTPDLPDPTRIITSTDLATGVSFFNSTFAEGLSMVSDLGGALFRLGYVSERPPQSLNGSDLDTYADYLTHVPPLVLPGGGAVVWYIDTPPGASSPLHRTVSLDFVIIIEGELELRLDSGEKRVLKAGDMIIQRGTTHMWTNLHQDKWLRMVGVMAAIEPITLDNGTQLGEYFPS
ncbi:hypothetical protein GQ53DRAFT_882832 [Thozetella sp. PMI_491]|nr:hypothetical protein GQ53DRAFT_882832 [Thozetella sp. PMI_491]